MARAMTKGAIVALINAAKRAQTSAGWKSVKPFLAMTPTAITIIDGEDDEEFVPETVEDEFEPVYA